MTKWRIIIMTLALASKAFATTPIVDTNGAITTEVPREALHAQSLQVSTKEPLPLTSWEPSHHADSFTALRKVANCWNDQPFLVYGKQDGDQPFRWEIVPYTQTNSTTYKYWQQYRTSFRIFFKPLRHTPETQSKLAQEYRLSLKQPFVPEQPITGPGDDIFGQQRTIERQQVYEGKLVRVLQDHKPLVGGAKLHFLIMPKAHRRDFRELTKEEYAEVMATNQHVLKELKKRHDIKTVYYLHKTGRVAGQTVPRWHLHIFCITSDVQHLMGKVNFYKNMTIGSRPMSDKELKERVLARRGELNPG